MQLQPLDVREDVRDRSTSLRLAFHCLATEDSTLSEQTKNLLQKEIERTQRGKELL